MGYNQQNPVINSDDDNLKKIEGQLDQILGDIQSQRTAFVNETEGIVKEIESSPEIPDFDPEEQKADEEITKAEAEFDDGLDDAIIDLTPKDGEIPE